MLFVTKSTVNVSGECPWKKYLFYNILFLLFWFTQVDSYFADNEFWQFFVSGGEQDIGKDSKKSRRLSRNQADGISQVRFSRNVCYLYVCLVLCDSSRRKKSAWLLEMQSAWLLELQVLLPIQRRALGNSIPNKRSSCRSGQTIYAWYSCICFLDLNLFYTSRLHDSA